MKATDPHRAEQALDFILSEINEGRIRLYRNVLWQPYLFCDHPKYPCLHLYLLDKDVRGWLTHFIWESMRLLLRDREIDRILEELTGRSLSEPLDKIHDPALLQFIESEPVVAVVLEFMHTKERFEATMEVLWKELSKFTRGRRLLVRGKNRFPGGANVLSRKLASLLHVFGKLGIMIDVKRSNGSKVILTRRLDDSSKQPSPESFAHNSGNSRSLPSKDDKAERILRLQERKQSTDRSSHE